MSHRYSIILQGMVGKWGGGGGGGGLVIAAVVLGELYKPMTIRGNPVQ